MPTSSSPTRMPESGAHQISIDDTNSPIVKLAVTYWKSLKGARRFPARADMTLRGMAAILPYCVIVRVIDDGADFEFPYVGEHQRQAFGVHLKGVRLTQVEAAAPELGKVFRAVYEQARVLGQPFTMRGRVNENLPGTDLLYYETAFLPLGASDSAVDHVLVVGVQLPTPFWSIPKGELQAIQDKTLA